MVERPLFKLKINSQPKSRHLVQIQCSDRFCRFSTAHPNTCVPPSCTKTCWSYRQFPQQYSSLFVLFFCFVSYMSPNRPTNGPVMSCMRATSGDEWQVENTRIYIWSDGFSIYVVALSPVRIGCDVTPTSHARHEVPTNLVLR